MYYLTLQTLTTQNKEHQTPIFPTLSLIINSLHFTYNFRNVTDSKDQSLLENETKSTHHYKWTDLPSCGRVKVVIDF